jgi:LPS-assembly protein
MKNKFIIILILFFKSVISTAVFAIEDFDFNIDEIQISNNGELIKGLKRGTVTSNSEQTMITADSFEYNKSTNILNAQGNVVVKDVSKNFIIKSNDITYFKNMDKIFSRGPTNGLISAKYDISSKNIDLDVRLNTIKSNNVTTIIDENFTEYKVDKLEYSINEKIFKGINITIQTNLNKPRNEREFYFFKNGIFDLANKEFSASETKIYVKKNIFDNSENDPRIYGVSSDKKKNKTTLNKASFTSCKLNDNCPPWNINAKKIIHDKEKKQIIYDDAVIKIYDFPVFYFPKFFHPDPSVDRQSGFLQPTLNNSNILGTSLMLPYFQVVSDNKDLTFKPIQFDGGMNMIQNEYRQKNKFSSFIGDFGYTQGYHSQSTGYKKKKIAHFFGKYDLDLNFDKFKKSKLNFNFQKVTNDTYLKVFESNLLNIDEKILPEDQNQLFSELNLSLNHTKYNFYGGIRAYESLDKKDSDRFQYSLPYYKFSKNFLRSSLGNFNFNSSGENNYKDTNSIRSKIINDVNFTSKNFYFQNGIVNRFNINLKNPNFVGKNDPDYKSSPQTELVSLFNFESNLPLIKKDKKFTNYLNPKISLRYNPTKMKESAEQEKLINTKNIFLMNRLGLNETLEEGESVTLGIDYKKENINNINKYFEFNLATIFRNEESKKIPQSSAIYEKQSNLFGSTNYNFSEKISFNYDFALDNDYSKFEYNSVGSNFSLGDFNTQITFLEKYGKMGSTNTIDNSTSLKFDEDKYIKFNTRRNRKIGLTEYYDLVYEYKNDCLTAGIKYKKSYYQDRDLKPEENLIFSITLFPITQYDQKIDKKMYSN